MSAYSTRLALQTSVVGAEYPVPMEARNGFRSIDPVAANALADRIASEIVGLTGCDPKAASRAAGAFVNMRNAPGFGLRDGTPQGSSAANVLAVWIEAKAEALVELAIAPLVRSSAAAAQRVA